VTPLLPVGSRRMNLTNSGGSSILENRGKPSLTLTSLPAAARERVARDRSRAMIRGGSLDAPGTFAPSL